MSSFVESGPTPVIAPSASVPQGPGEETPTSPIPFPTGPVYSPAFGEGEGGEIQLTNWRAILCDLDSNPIAEISDEMIQPSITQVHNGIDRGSFTLNLESQAAYICTPVKTLIKIWRDVPGYVSFPDGIPQMVGVITSRTRNAEQRTATYNWHSPFWRLSLRHHVDAHDFSWETGRGLVGVDSDNPTIPHGGTDPTEIMWQMIDFTNQVVQYSGGDRTGVRVFSPAAKADYFGADPSVLLNIRYAVGQNTWDLIEDIVSKSGMPDLSPTYIHVEGSPELVWFNTVIHKGETKSISFDYRTGSKNLDDIQETTSAESGEYANYVVVQGQGDKSTGWYDPDSGFSGLDQTIARADGTSFASSQLGLPDLISDHGLYMHFERDDNNTSNVGRYKTATYLLGRMAYPPTTYEITPTQSVTWAWPYEFQAGDTITLNCDRDSMQFADVPMRITEVTIERTPTKMEKLSMVIVDPDSYKVYEN